MRGQEGKWEGQEWKRRQVKGAAAWSLPLPWPGRTTLLQSQIRMQLWQKHVCLLQPFPIWPCMPSARKETWRQEKLVPTCSSAAALPSVAPVCLLKTKALFHPANGGSLEVHAAATRKNCFTCYCFLRHVGTKLKSGYSRKERITLCRQAHLSAAAASQLDSNMFPENRGTQVSFTLQQELLQHHSTPGSSLQHLGGKPLL